MQISAKDLGWLATSDFCPRCFWIKRHDRRLPYQTPFAGIFSSIDAYTKHIVSKHLERHNKLPIWLDEIGEVKKRIDIKPASFRTIVDGATLTGIPDAVFQRNDDSYIILDYKTARYTGTQDALMPVYEIQLNGYALIAESIGLKPVRDMFLVYFEPPYRERFDQLDLEHTTEEGFEMPFVPRVHKVRKNTKEVLELLQKAERIYDLKSPPKGTQGCEDCERLADLVGIAGT